MLTPDDTQPIRPTNEPAASGPGCLAWGLLALAAGALSLLIVFGAGVLGYLTGQGTIERYAVGTREAFIADQLSTWIPGDIAEGNVVLLGARIDGLASLTPPPTEIAGLIATGTQFALDNQPTTTPTPSATVTAPPTSTPPPLPTTAPTADTQTDADAPLFEVDTLFTEAETQMTIGQYEEAVRTLNAINALDPSYRSNEVEAMLFEAWNTRARRLLRSGNPQDLAGGIRAASEASVYGDIDDLAYESYIAGLYLDAQSKEALNPLGAVTVYSNIYAQTPNYLDVRTKLYNLRIALGDERFEAFDFCPAVTQYTAALGVQPNAAEAQTKLEAAQQSCDSGEAPPGTTPLAPGEADTTADEAGEEAPTSTPSGPAPLGQRDG